MRHSLHYSLVVVFALLTIATACTDRKAEDDVSEVVRTARADRKQAIEYDGLWQMRLAEMYYRKAYESLQDDPSQDWFTYGDAGYRYAFLTCNRGDVEGALAIVAKIMDRIEKNPKTEPEVPPIVVSALLSLMAECQMQLSMTDEAKQTFARSYEEVKKAYGGECRGKFNMVIACYDLFQSFLQMDDYDAAERWMHRGEEEFAVWEEMTMKGKAENRRWRSDSLLLEEYRGHRALSRTLLLQATGHAEEAAATYDAIPRSRIFNPLTISSAARYLMAAGRYDEAADMYARLDTTYAAADSARMTFDKISECLAPRYAANRKAGVIAEALATADKMSAAIDSALVWQKRNDAAELAVIYQTHEKDMQLANQRFTISLHRLFAVALVVILLLIAWQLWRFHIYNKVLSAKNRHLLAKIEKQERKKLQAIEQLNAEPEESLTASQQFYRRLCTIMSEQRPYTNEALNRDTLAQLLGTNAKYVEQAIRECSDGETVGDFITRYRLEYVSHQLRTTDDSISLIGELSGIPNRATLARLFRNAYGMTCSEYRQAVKSKATK